MLTEERHRLILQLLKGREIVKIGDFVEATKSSESTIRRDLSELELQKKLKRVHGGASIIRQKRVEPGIEEKSTKNNHEKDLIAKYAASLIQNGDCLYLDAGTTTFHLIQFLSQKNITVVTNGLTHLEELLKKGVTTYIIGGLVKPNTRAIIGNMSLESLSKFRFDKCFLGVNGIHPEYGFTTPDPEEAALKSLALSLSQESYFLADNSKYNEIAFAKIANIDEAIIISNEIDEDIFAVYAEKKTTIKVVTS